MRQLQRFAIACAVLAGCDTTLDREKLVADIVTTLKGKGVADATISCPDVKKVTASTRFQCAGTGFGKPFKVDVVVTDDKGTMKWDLVGKIADTEPLATYVQPKITEKIGSPAVVSCAQKKAILAPKDTLTCDITIEGKAGHILITVADNGEDVSWEILK